MAAASFPDEENEVEIGVADRKRSLAAVVTNEVRGFLPRWVSSTDTRIGDAGVSYNDPEFAPGAPWVAWQESDGQVWTCRYEPNSGELIPRDGRGRKIGIGVPIFSVETSSVTNIGVYNGPEWGLSRQGWSICYVAGDRSLDYRLMQYRLRDNSLEAITPANTPIALGAFPNQDRTAATDRVAYGRLVFTESTVPTFDTEVLELEKPRPPSRFPLAIIGTSGPRWLTGEPLLLTNALDADGVVQIATFNARTGETTLLTDGPGNKYDAMAADAPEFGGRRLISCIVEGTRIAFYREPFRTDTPWQFVTEIVSPVDSLPKLMGADPFVYRGRTYVVYVAANQRQESRICLSSVDGKVSTTISDPASFRGFDPEVVVSNGRLFVYYLEPGLTLPIINKLHRCNVQIFP